MMIICRIRLILVFGGKKYVRIMFVMKSKVISGMFCMNLIKIM